MSDGLPGASAPSQTPATPERAPAPAPLTLVEAPVAGQEPPWLTEALAPVLAFLGTAWAFGRNPARFTRAWLVGEQKAVNPLLFVGTAAAATAFAMRASLTLVGRTPSHSFFSQFLVALAPHLYYFQLGLVTHAVLRLFGSRRRWTSSVAVSLYAGGTFATLAMLVALLVGLVLHFTLGLTPGESTPVLQAAPAWTRPLVFILVGGTFSAFLSALCMGFAVLHRASASRMALALTVALVVTGLLARVAPLPTMQLVVMLKSKGPVPFFDLRF